MPFYEKSANGEEYRDSKGKWHVKQSLIEHEKESYEARNKLGGSLRYVENNAKRFHKGTDPVKPYGYKRDILFGEKGSRSTGKLKDF